MNKNTKKSRQNNSAGKAILREIVKQQLSEVMGPAMAKQAYRASAKSVKSVRKRTKKISGAFALSGTARVRSATVGDTLVLSRPSSLYVKSFMDPFNQICKGIGTPRPGSAPSYKTTGFVRGSGAIGTNGFGFVFGMPCIANDFACIGWSPSGYVPINIQSFAKDAVAPVLPEAGLAASASSPAGLAMTNLPFNRDQLVTEDILDAVQGRIVSCSIKLVYTGTNLNMSGQYYAYQDPDMTQMQGGAHTKDAASGTPGASVATLATKDGCEICPVSRKEARIVWIPNSNNMLDYPNRTATDLRKIYPFSNGTTQYDNDHASASGAICITGKAGEPFYFEMVTHCEFVGPGVPQSLLTESSSDIVAFDSIQCVLARAQRNAANDARIDLNSCIKRELARERIRLV